MSVESLNKAMQIQEDNLDSMITELVEREEFTGGGGGGCEQNFQCTGFTWN